MTTTNNLTCIINLSLELNQVKDLDILLNRILTEARVFVNAIERANMTRSMILRTIEMARLRDSKETGTHVQRVASYSVAIY